jgi:hypothetical protein
MKRIVVIRAGALGDTVLTFPALSLLRRRYPDAEITAIGRLELWETAGDLIDRAMSIDDPRVAGLVAGELQEPATWLEGVDLAIAWTARDPREVLRRAGAREVVHASPYPPPGVHAAQWLVECLSPLLPESEGSLAVYGVELGIPGGCASLRRQTQRDCGTSGKSTARWRGRAEALDYVPVQTTVGDEGPAFIHPGAGAMWKRWPAERFAALGERLRQAGLPVVLIEGPADEGAVAAVQRAVNRPFPVLRGLSPAQLGDELRRGRLFVGNDSGVTHLAAWTGVPTLALFGPTDPASWAPLGDAHVLRACRKGAQRQGEIRVCEDPGCMDALSLDRVLEAALDLAAVLKAGGEPCR